MINPTLKQLKAAVEIVENELFEITVINPIPDGCEGSEDWLNSVRKASSLRYFIRLMSEAVYPSAIKEYKLLLADGVL